MSKLYGVRLLLLCALSLASSSAAFASDGDKHGGRKCDDDSVMRSESCRGEDCREHKDCDDNDEDGNNKEFCEEFHGAAFGLCNAFCNAQQCHLFPKHSCDVLRQNFERQTGLSTFPCEGEGTPTLTPTDTPLPLTLTTTPTLTAAGTATATATIATATATGTATSATVTATATDTAAAPSATATSEPFQTGTATATDTPEVPVATATSTQLATPTGTAAAVIGAQCACDCDGNGRVSIDDLLRSVLVVLGGVPQSDCEALADDGALRIQDLIRGVRNALDGCS